MSANPVARPQSRRGLLTAALAGTAASAATFGGHVVLAATATPDPAEAAFLAWIKACGVWNQDYSEKEAHEAVMEHALTLERALVNDLSPSPMAAAVLALNHLPYLIDTPDENDPSLSSVMSGTFDERLPYSVLRCLRPVLTGTIKEIVADLLDNPDRALCESLIFRAYCGEVSL